MYSVSGSEQIFDTLMLPKWSLISEAEVTVGIEGFEEVSALSTAF